MLCAQIALTVAACSRVLDIRDFGAIESDVDGFTNREAIKSALGNCTAEDTVLIPAGNWMSIGGINTTSPSVNILLEGNLIAVDNFDTWPIADGRYLNFIEFIDTTVTMKGTGTINGQGKKWWNKWIINPISTKRPKLVYCERCNDSLFEGFTLTDSPSWHLVFSDSFNCEVGHINITVNRKLPNVSNLSTAPEDLNTDGIDISGHNFYVHDSYVQNDDDSIAVKPSSTLQCTQNVTIIRTTLTGYGASIGSVPPSVHGNCVKDVLFKDIYMPETGKGIYVKSNPKCGGNKTSLIQDITYENITIIKPSMWAIWIGPQQQHEPGQKLGDKCALTYPIDPHCPTQGCTSFRNITLKDVFIDSPLMSPGVILGNSTNPMEVTLNNVQVKNPGLFPYDGKYHCENTKITVINSDPIPQC
eukprot:TRINITY_DN18567_c0_g1_i1.p1 TRINITY_DN18567_c0_g1~~TRINITY_DN18567_c0_g1_i1.p1  ORF type:complete len:416 (+),score=79.41 TRINITY_DN18567_c0_g1_i1:88-1335(+)